MPEPAREQTLRVPVRGPEEQERGLPQAATQLPAVVLAVVADVLPGQRQGEQREQVKAERALPVAVAIAREDPAVVYIPEDPRALDRPWFQSSKGGWR